MGTTVAILGIVATLLGFLIPILKKRMETKDADHSALNRLGADEFHAGVTGGVQPPAPPMQPK
jgi:hypothetical protein